MREAPNFFNTSVEKSDNDPNKQEGGRYDGATEGEDSLIPKVKIEQTELSEESLIELSSLMKIYLQNMARRGISDSLERIDDFLKDLIDLYGVDTVKNCSLYYLLKGEDIPVNIDRLDLSDNDFSNFITSGFSSKEDSSE
jgi:hypothetical protein